MGKLNNVVVAQSGGPSPVINNSLRGVIAGCVQYEGRFGRIYAGYHGILGVLSEQLLDLTAQSDEEIQLLRTTPAAGAIGTCRYKLKADRQEDFERIVEVFKAHDVKYFFYIGGNDSMDTADKIAELAGRRDLDLVATGVAKTIDNDVGDAEFRLVDHTPGFGSTARYWALNIQNLNEESRGSSPSDPVIVVQAMGRKVGFIPAAARLGDPNREMPLQIYTPESGLGLDELTDRVADQIRTDGRALVVVSEGFDVGQLGEAKDAFGHTEFGASETTVAQVVVNHLNRAGLRARGKVRGQVSGTDQRDTMIYASTVDLEEAYRVGLNAVRIAAEDGSGYMSTIVRRPGPLYRVEFDKAPLSVVANSERRLPSAWISEDRTDVTDDFVRYARPLIGDDWVSVPLVNGLQRFARLDLVFADVKLPRYVPAAYR